MLQHEASSQDSGSSLHSDLTNDSQEEETDVEENDNDHDESSELSSSGDSGASADSNDESCGWQRILENALQTMEKPDNWHEYTTNHLIREPNFSDFLDHLREETEELLKEVDNFKSDQVYEKIENSAAMLVDKDCYENGDANEAAWEKHRILVKKKIKENEGFIDNWMEDRVTGKVMMSQ